MEQQYLFPEDTKLREALQRIAQIEFVSHEFYPTAQKVLQIAADALGLDDYEPTIEQPGLVLLLKKDEDW